MTATFQPDRMPGYVLPKYEYRRPPELGGSDSPLYPVIVVGAGLAGLTSALELGSRGVRTVLLDDDDTVGAQGLSSRGICHAKRSLEIFDRFGVAERIRAKGVTWNEGDVFVCDEHIFRFNLQPEQDQKFPAFVNLQQFYVEQYLVEALQRMESVSLRWKNRVAGAKPQADHVALTVETPDGRYSLRAQYVVAADGAHSVLREQIGAKDAESSLFDNHWCIADVKMPGTPGAVRKAFLDAPQNDGGAIWYHQMADGIWRTDWLISHYDDPDAEAKPERAKERLKKLLGPDAPFELVWVGPWRFRRRVLERMTHGRVFFMGDASAQHSPFGARGGNRAVQDANNLAWKLALVVQGRADERLLDSYEGERIPVARRLLETTDRAFRIVVSDSWIAGLLRTKVLARIAAFAMRRERVQRFAFRAVSQIGIHYRESSLSESGPALPEHAPRAGDRFPWLHLKLQAGGPVEDLFQKFDDLHFHLLVAGQPVPQLAIPESLLQVHAIPSDAANDAELARARIAQTSYYLVRPDGYIALAGTNLEPGAVERYLSTRLALGG